MKDAYALSPMLSRLCSLAYVLLIAALLTTTASAKDKNKKPLLSPFILRAHTVVVVIDPDAGEPLDEPNANASARTAVEKALLEWGRFDLLSQGQETDLIIVVRTGNGKLMRPPVKGGPIDQRPVSGESTDSTIHIGAQHGQPPPLQGNSIPDPDPNRGPPVSNEVGPSEDMFEVYRGNVPDPLDSMSIWRYIAKDCLREPKVTAVEEFRKAIADSLSDGAATVASNGFFDVDNVPPWDTWLYFDGRTLVTWVPPQLISTVQLGIDVNPESWIRWAD